MLNKFGPHFLLLFLLIGVYSPAMSSGFVLDDVFLIVQNDSLVGENAVKRAILGDLWSSDPFSDQQGFYRPVFQLSMVLERWMFGLQPLGFHFLGIFWHLITVSVLYFWLSNKFGSTRALMGAGVFAFHPIQIEPIVWISARNDVYVALFVLLCFWTARFDLADKETRPGASNLPQPLSREENKRSAPTNRDVAIGVSDLLIAIDRKSKYQDQ